MPWTHSDYPQSMKNLDRVVRNKAVDIANALLEEGYEEGRAIAIATSQAEKWAENHHQDDESADDEDSAGADSPRNFIVAPHPDGWGVARASGQNAVSVFSDREDARNFAVEQAESEGVNVVIHGGSGQVEDYVSLVDQVIPASNRVENEPEAEENDRG